MMSPDRLRDLCRQIRAEKRAVDDELLREIEADVIAYRSRLTGPRTQRPPADLEELLPLMGWLLLEASLEPLWRVAADYEALPPERRRAGEEAAALIERTANAARRLPWPHYAPRALGAIRCQALVASKRDTEAGYDDAWLLHQEARQKHASFLDSHGTDGAERYLRDLDEMLLQLALAETGTACRTAEKVIGRWTEGRADGLWGDEHGPRWTQQMFRRLSDAVALGERALKAAEEIEQRWGFTYHVDETHLALPTSYRLPGIMTARAILLMHTLTPAMEWLGMSPGEGFETWGDARAAYLKRFRETYGYIERTVVREDGSPWPPLLDHERSVVQLRLHLALVHPGAELSTGLDFDPCVSLSPLDDEAVGALSGWLGTYGKTRGQQRGDANLIGCATKPDFLAAVETLRHEAGATSDYRGWRQRWFILDRYHEEPGRRERVEQAFDENH